MGKRGYHKGNFYLRVLEVQAEYLKHSNSGCTTQYIYETYIHDRFHISRATFYAWLAINARAGLKKLQEQQARYPELPFNDSGEPPGQTG